MTQTLIEKLELFVNSFQGDMVRIDDLRAIIEQYKTEGAGPDAWTWERATEISELPGKEKYGGFERVHSRNKPNIPEGDKSRRNLRPLYFHPSPAIVAELVKALETELTHCHADYKYLRGQSFKFAGFNEWLERRADKVQALLARAKGMMG